MAVGNLTGLETGDSGELTSLSGTSSIQSTTKRTGTYALRTNPTTTNVGHGVFDLRLGTAALATSWWRFYFQYATKPAANSEPCFQCLTSGSGLKFEVRMDSAGHLLAYDAAVGLLGTGTTVLSASTWYRIEVKVGSSATVGAWEIKIDGTSELSGSSNTNATAGSLGHFGKPSNRNGQTVDFFYDDIVVDDTAYLGAGEVRTLTVDSAGSTSQWTAGTGATFAEVDDFPGDDATTYLQSTAQNDVHLLGLTSSASASISGVINAVKGGAKTQRAAASNGSATLRLRSGGSNADGTATTTLSGFNWRSYHVRSTDPSTSSAWTTSGLDSLEVGVLDSSATQRSRVTSLAVFVDFRPVVAYTLSLDAASATITGQALGVRAARTLATDPASCTITGQTIGVRATRTCTLSPSSVTLTGQTVGLRATRYLSLSPSSYTVSGQDVGVFYGRALGLSPASVTITGQDVGLRATRLLGLDPASVVISGQSVSLLATRRLALDPSSVVIDAQDLTLTFASVGAYVLSLSPAAMAITGGALGVTATRRLVVDAAATTVTGATVGITAARRLSLDPAAVAVTEQALTVRADRRLPLGALAVTITGGALVFNSQGNLIGIIDLAGAYTPVVVMAGAQTRTIALDGIDTPIITLGGALVID